MSHLATDILKCWRN